MIALAIALEHKSGVSNNTNKVTYYIYLVEAKFVNPKIVTNVPGPGAHEPMDVYTTKE